jgi:hypothetical protein
MTQTMIRPGVWLSPEPVPIKGTLLDVATELPAEMVRSRGDMGAIFSTLNCMAVDHVSVDPCPESTLAAPVQSAATTATTGGTLAAGTYKAVITAVNAQGETVASNEISATTTGSTGKITWNWATVANATGYKVYVTALGGASGSETYLVTASGQATALYAWTGTPAQNPAGATPPTYNGALVTVAKTFDGAPSFQDGLKFSVYAGFICKSVGLDMAATNADIERVFNNKESVAVARALMTTRFVAGTGSATWSAATDITPSGGAVNPDVGLALLEEHAGVSYAGEPVVHTPRSIGSLLTRNGQAGMDGNVLRSSLGTPIAADPGYGLANVTSGATKNNSPTGTAPAAGELWMYASGMVTVAASAPFQQGGMDLVETTDSNRIRILRERMYVATVDCYTAAVRVKVA